MNNFSKEFLEKSVKVIEDIDSDQVENLINSLIELKSNSGRLFCGGSGGSSGTASHACSDFSNLAQIESHCISDNSSFLTTQINDFGWDNSYAAYLKSCKLNFNDALLILSVGGGDRDKKISNNLVVAMDYAKSCGAKVYSIVGRTGGYAKQISDNCVLIPDLYPELTTFLVEGICSLLLHGIVAHNGLRKVQAKWESVDFNIQHTK